MGKRLKKKVRRNQKREVRTKNPTQFTNTAMVPGAIIFEFKAKAGVLGDSFEIILLDRKNRCVLDKVEFHQDLIKSQDDLKVRFDEFKQSLFDEGVL